MTLHRKLFISFDIKVKFCLPLSLVCKSPFSSRVLCLWGPSSVIRTTFSLQCWFLIVLHTCIRILLYTYIRTLVYACRLYYSLYLISVRMSL